MAEQEEQQRQVKAEEERLRAEDECQKNEDQGELEKKQHKINDFVMPWPSQFTIGKFKNFSFTELWYFTEEACSGAQKYSRTLPDDAYGITQVDDLLVTLKHVTAFKALKNTIPDNNLTWRQMNICQNMIHGTVHWPCYSPCLSANLAADLSDHIWLVLLEFCSVTDYKQKALGVIFSKHVYKNSCNQ